MTSTHTRLVCKNNIPTTTVDPKETNPMTTKTKTPAAPKPERNPLDDARQTVAWIERRTFDSIVGAYERRNVASAKIAFNVTHGYSVDTFNIEALIDAEANLKLWAQVGRIIQQDNDDYDEHEPAWVYALRAIVAEADYTLRTNRYRHSSTSVVSNAFSEADRAAACEFVRTVTDTLRYVDDVADVITTGEAFEAAAARNAERIGGAR